MYATPDEAVELARKAFRLDTTNKWYHQFYGQALIYAGRYDEALKVYRRLQTENPKDPDNYRILAALYEQKQSPVMALVTLDSAELRFGRIPRVERHETASAGGDEPDRQSRGRSPGDGRSCPL